MTLQLPAVREAVGDGVRDGERPLVVCALDLEDEEDARSWARFRSCSSVGTRSPAEPLAEATPRVELEDLVERPLDHGAAAIRGPVERLVVEHHQVAVGGQVDIRLDGSTPHRPPLGTWRWCSRGRRSSGRDGRAPGARMLEPGGSPGVPPRAQGRIRWRHGPEHRRGRRLGDTHRFLRAAGPARSGMPRGRCRRPAGRRVAPGPHARAGLESLGASATTSPAGHARSRDAAAPGTGAADHPIDLSPRLRGRVVRRQLLHADALGSDDHEDVIEGGALAQVVSSGATRDPRDDGRPPGRSPWRAVGWPRPRRTPRRRAGLPYSSSGGPACSIRPARTTTTSSENRERLLLVVGT